MRMLHKEPGKREGEQTMSGRDMTWKGACLALALVLGSCGGGGGGTADRPSGPGQTGAAKPDSGTQAQGPQPQTDVPPGTTVAAGPDRNIDLDFKIPPLDTGSSFDLPGGGGGQYPRQVPDAPGSVLTPDGDVRVIGPGLFGLELTNFDEVESVDPHGEFAIFHGEVSDGAGGAELARLLTSDEDGNTVRFQRWGSPPVVHVAPGTSAELAANTRLIVNYMNSALPHDWQVTWSDERLAASGQTGKIVVSFAPAEEWQDAGYGAHPTVLGVAAWRTLNGIVNSASVWVDPDRVANVRRDLNESFQKLFMLKVIAHEMLHALGREHADPERFMETILHPSAGENIPVPGVLRQLDNEALLAAYGSGLTASICPVDGEPSACADLVSQALGPWETDSIHVAARLAFGTDGALAFGAAERNELVRPWAVGGPVPAVGLNSNLSLGGTATWEGRLVGLTPAAAPVAGAASMTVDISALTGSLDFTELEQWAHGAPPGAVGSGTMWEDGDLSYAISVGGNNFRETSGSTDTGRVEGGFFGSGHEAMAGVLTRRDLSAGFGGKRP